MVLIFTTSANKVEAKKIGNGLLKKHLIACYNMFPVESAYWWKGKIENAKEVLVVLKTRQENFTAVETFIKKQSSYTTPEIVSVKAQEVNLPYLSWLDSETK